MIDERLRRRHGTPRDRQHERRVAACADRLIGVRMVFNERHGRHILSAEELRAVRAIEVLTQIGTPDAVVILKDLSSGAEGAVETEHARRALRLLTGRAASR